jgi:AMMECR1 domain-containing protein
VTLARSTIQEKLGIPAAPDLPGNRALRTQPLQAKAGTFVTLTLGGELRGCIGSLEHGLHRGRVRQQRPGNAAFPGPRFPALTRKELEKVHIEVCVLTEPRVLNTPMPGTS